MHDETSYESPRKGVKRQLSADQDTIAQKHKKSKVPTAVAPLAVRDVNKVAVDQSPDQTDSDRDEDSEEDEDTKQRRKGKFEISPIKAMKAGGIGKKIRERAVYVHFACKDNDFSFIPQHADRVDFETLFSDDDFKDEDLNSALLKAEIKIMQWIEKDIEFYNKALYVGLAKNASHRSSGHKSDCSKIDENEDISYIEASKKLDWISGVWNDGYDVRMSCLIYQIPEEYLPVVEILMGELLNIRAKGNTLLGNDEAYKRFNAYFASAARKQRLKKENLHGICENLKKQQRRASMSAGINS